MRRDRPIPRISQLLRAKPRTVVGVLLGLLVVGSAAALVIRHRLEASERPLPVQPVKQPVADPLVRPSRTLTFADGCTTSGCHADVSNAPAMHAPVAQGACDVCHAPDAGGHKYPLLKSKADVCSACHDTGGHEQFQHRAMSEDACLACHNPHKGATPALLTADSTIATCTRCHQPIQGRIQHKPYATGRCDDCHDPHGSDNRHLLVSGEGAELCKRCHAPIVQAVETSPHAHRTQEGSCAACHSPHASDTPGLLRAQARDLCVTCHKDVAQTVSTARVTHDPVLKDHQCVTCHDPHASGNPKMLRASQATICLSCHDKQVVAADGRKIKPMAKTLASSPVVHGAVTRGDCSACHSVHGSTHERLLSQINPNVLPGPFDISNYALCFSCHDKNLAGPGTATQFRDGDRNLHESHLHAGDKSRGCEACHAVHASDLPRLIATTVQYEGGEWAMPMKFEITPTGGSCAPGCHEQMSYSRSPGGANGRKNGGSP